MTLLVDVVETSGRVTATRSRLEKIRGLAGCLRRLEPREIVPGVAFLSGEVRQGRLGIGYASLRDVRPAPAPQPGLTIGQVDQMLQRLQGIAGAGSRSLRLQMLNGLLGRATEAEQRFLRRLLVGELRQGALEGVMVEAVAEAAEVPAAAVRRALMLHGDLGEVASVALIDGEAGLARFTMRLFRPVQPMLAQTAEDVADAIRRLEHAAVEWKLDGARVQVHRNGDSVRVYSRRQNDVTAAVPEIVETVRRLPATKLVLDGEVIALRPDGSPHPFQVTMRRFGRRLDVERLRQTIPLVPFFFDCLHLDGEDLIDRPARQRMEAVQTALTGDLIVPRLVTGDVDEAAAFMTTALQRGHEGVVAKSLEATYEAGRRGAGWLKVKPSHTLDLVVLAAEWGSGRRRGWLSNLHLGARDPADNSFVMLGKTFKGMTDEMLRWQTKRLQELEIARDEYTVHVRPELVVEVAFDGVQSSPQYPGGLALRFARVKQYRPDKPAAEADTIERVRKIAGGRD